MRINVFQFHGCDKCFHETLLLGGDHEITRVTNPGSWNPTAIDVAVITGYLLEEDRVTVTKITENSGRTIAFGSCPASGGVYGLSYQKGYPVTTLHQLAGDITNVHGCMGEVEELDLAINGTTPSAPETLCSTCSRQSTCNYLKEVVRQVNLENIDPETCFNDLGYLCSGYVARECKERCIDSNTPCRGCKPSLERSGIRLLGMFGTLMGNIDLATEATGKGGTDKLADKDDGVTASFPDLVGNFFRFNLVDSGLPVGKIPPNGSLLNDVFRERPIEELPLISGLLGGHSAISLTLDLIEAYEDKTGVEVTAETKQYRDALRQLEQTLKEAITSQDAQKYREVTNQIRKIAGNMNLSNIFFGGFKKPVDDASNFAFYRAGMFQVKEGTYEKGSVKYTIDKSGVVTEFSWKDE